MEPIICAASPTVRSEGLDGWMNGRRHGARRQIGGCVASGAVESAGRCGAVSVRGRRSKLTSYQPAHIGPAPITPFSAGGRLARFSWMIYFCLTFRLEAFRLEYV